MYIDWRRGNRQWHWTDCCKYQYQRDEASQYEYYRNGYYNKGCPQYNWWKMKKRRWRRMMHNVCMKLEIKQWQFNWRKEKYL